MRNPLAVVTALVVTLLACAPALAQGKPPLPSKAEVLRAINLFEADPLGPKAKEYARTIVVFATDSDDVLIELSTVTCPFVDEKDKRYQDVLLTAFTAGNTRQQLLTGKAQDQSAAGVRLALAVYAKIRAQDPAYDSPGMGALAEQERAGKLESYLAQARSRNKTPAKIK